MRTARKHARLPGRLLSAAVLIVAAAASGAGCRNADGVPVTAANTVAVNAADATCAVAATTLPAGLHVFRVANTGAKVTEFYLYGPDGRAVGEVENIAPGLTRDLRVDLTAGAYEGVCKPGMTGDGIRQPLTVTPTTSAAPRGQNPLLPAAASAYQGYVRRQSDDLLTRTRAWVALIRAGDTTAAKAAFGATRAPYERIEPVAESFTDLDRRIDARDTDLEPGVTWTGFHRIERDLWRGGRPDPAVVAALLDDVTALHRRLATQTFTALDLANGAKSLLDEVATKKVTGEEDRFSHTDLSDFAANVDGSEAAVKALRPALDEREPTLGPRIDEQFAAVRTALRRHHTTAGGFVSYTALHPEQIKELSDAINALSEPVSRVAAAISAR